MYSVYSKVCGHFCDKHNSVVVKNLGSQVRQVWGWIFFSSLFKVSDLGIWPLFPYLQNKIIKRNAFILVIYGWVTNCLKTYIRCLILEVIVKLSVGAEVIRKLDPFWRISFQYHSDVCWQKALVSYHVCLSVALLTTWQWTFPRTSYLREKASVTKTGTIVSFIT